MDGFWETFLGRKHCVHDTVLTFISGLMQDDLAVRARMGFPVLGWMLSVFRWVKRNWTSQFSLYTYCITDLFIFPSKDMIKKW